jgi:hypothetical protein
VNRRMAIPLCQGCHEAVTDENAEDALSPDEFWHPRCWRQMLFEHPIPFAHEAEYALGFDEFLEYIGIQVSATWELQQKGAPVH